MESGNDGKKIRSDSIIDACNVEINYQSTKNPNLKYKSNILCFGKKVPEVFEIFTSHKDNKEYIAYKDYKLIIFDIYENKKIKELDFKKVFLIKYFINQNNLKEYLLVISDKYYVLEISNNYNIIYQYQDKYPEAGVFTMFFTENTNNGYIIKSDYAGYSGENSSSYTVRTLLFSLNETKIKEIVIYYNYYQAHNDYGITGKDIGPIRHLLVWYNKINNDLKMKNYIIYIIKLKMDLYIIKRMIN